MLPVVASAPRERRLSPRLMTRHARFRMPRGPPSDLSIAEKDVDPHTPSIESSGRIVFNPTSQVR